MRVLVTADPPVPVPPQLYGGIERIIAGLIAGLNAMGHTVGLLSHADSTQPCARRWAWPHAAPRRARQHWQNLSKLQSVLADFQPDVLHSFSRLLYLGRVLTRRNLPKVMSFQREPTPRTVRWAARAAGPSLHFTGCSEYIARAGRAIGGQWSAIPNFVELATYPYVPQVADDAPLVFLSRVDSDKGADRAIAIARGSGRRLIIAGNTPESGPEADYFRDRIAPAIDGRQIEYIGPVNDAQKAALLGRAAAMVVPINWNEPFGIVFIEALACGTPVISCPRGALPEIVRNGTHGYLVDSDAEGIAAVARLGRIARSACRARVEEAFSRNVIVEQYDALYRGLVR